MPPRKKRWIVSPSISPEANQDLLGYPPVLRQVLYNRGVFSQPMAELYLNAAPPPGTDPFFLSGMQAAVDRIAFAIDHNQPIAVYGDYDVDGVTATALMVQALSVQGANVTGYIPNRFEEGYGLNNDALKGLHERGVKLVITVDCGIRSPVEASYAANLGLDLIITDHHHPGSEIPLARAVINPKLPDDAYPEKDLAGVGLAYKLISALHHTRPDTPLQPDDFLDLVALGTVADLAPLVGENRSLVRSGLLYLQNPRRQGILSLMGASGLAGKRINAGHIGFILGPRLNASGRLESAQAALDLLTTGEVQIAGILAQKLHRQNVERQELTRQIQAQAEIIATETDPDPLLLFAADPSFNPGVVGLAASRLTELYYRPAIVGQRGEEYTRASCRSIPEFHITDALDECADLLEHHGGHRAAAGFTVRNDRLPQLLEQLNTIAARQLSGLDLTPTLTADIDLPLSELRPEILKYLEWVEPTGYGNPQVHFISRNLKVTGKRLVGDSKHLKLTVTDGRITYDAIAFGQAAWYEQMPANLDLYYTFEINEYNGRSSFQLNVRDIRPSEG